MPWGAGEWKGEVEGQWRQVVRPTRAGLAGAELGPGTWARLPAPEPGNY
jgi:hypothetical protein